MAGKYTITTLNVNGLRQPNKRKCIFQYLKTKGTDICLLQEVHIDKNEDKLHEEPNIRVHESIMPNWARSDPVSVEQKKSPFDLVNDPIPGKWGKNPIKLDIEESSVEVSKVEVFKNTEDKH